MDAGRPERRLPPVIASATRTRALRRPDLPKEHARIVADRLVGAELHGIYSRGVIRVKIDVEASRPC